MTYYQSAALGVAAIDCQNQVRSWRLLRSLMKLLIPTCNCIFVEEDREDETMKQTSISRYLHSSSKPSSICPHPIVGTIFGYRNEKVSFCLQSGSKSTTPILLLELPVPTKTLAREMQGGVLRIELKCNTKISTQTARRSAASYDSIFSMSVWTMFCNGRKVGFATKRKPSRIDMEMLRRMGSVIVGAGIIKGKDLKKDDDDDELMYLRANFERVRSSTHTESFHLIDPEGYIGQELSIFFHRR